MISENIDQKCFLEYIKYIHELTGVTIDESRSAMLVTRIRRRLLDLKITDYADYLCLVRLNKKEREYFIDQITTHETYFYRTPRVWEYLENEYFPTTLSEQKKSFRIWSAASSSGEEAYTMGILCEKIKLNNPELNYHILATDVSNAVVNKASRGIYKGRSIKRFKDLRPDLFKSFMNPGQDEEFEVHKKIKSNINFERHNLFQELEGRHKFDIILLRNVLIYFTKEDQMKVLKRISHFLQEDGLLIIGESESLARLDNRFESISPLIYKIKDIKDIKGVA